jgi:hypothetical protein
MFLIYINPLNKNYKGEYIYEFLFSEEKEFDINEEWFTTPASSGIMTPPSMELVVKVGLLKTNDIELDLAMFSDYFSLTDSLENIVALGWEKESPDNEERLVFHFWESFDSVVQKLYSRDKIMEIEKNEYHE